MSKATVYALRIATIGATVLMTSNLAHAQVDGAVQYPPPSAGKDAQPPPPAGMVPQKVAPRRIELGISGSSRPPAGYALRVPERIDTVGRPMEPAPPRSISPTLSPGAGGN